MEALSQIKPEILQQFMESCANPSAGMSQYFTPPDFGAWCAQGLPRIRETLVDLNCGNGQLLHASALAAPVAKVGRASPRAETSITTTLLGSDIDPQRNADGVTARRIHYDVTLLYPLLKEVQFNADCFVLNPPWRLFWHRDRLKDLAESDLQAVRDAYAAEEPGTPRDTIDSTIATLMMALDLCTSRGEGFLIANNNTLDRLIFGFNSLSASGGEGQGEVASKYKPPYAALAKHIWARVIVDGNPMTGIDVAKWNDKSDANGAVTEFKTGIIYFAASHTTGPTDYDYPNVPDRILRMGSQLNNEYYASRDSLELWEAARERVQELQGKQTHTPFNIWLSDDGTIRTALSSFESKSVKTDKKEAERLFNLAGKRPMELVLQRADRDNLLHAIRGYGKWKVDPDLVTAVDVAIQQYHAARAPLYPLEDIKRLGYLDEQDTIECRADLSLQRDVVQYKLETEDGSHYIYNPQGEIEETFDSDNGGIKAAKVKLKELNDKLPPSGLQCIYKAGQKYSIRTQTVQVTRTVTKPNSFTGDPERLEFTGQQLAIFIADRLRSPSPGGEGRGEGGSDDDKDIEEFCFMDGTLRDGATKINEARQNHNRRRSRYGGNGAGAEVPIDFTLDDLVKHFIIPEVPDVATNNPDAYKHNLKILDEIEFLVQE